MTDEHFTAKKLKNKLLKIFYGFLTITRIIRFYFSIRMEFTLQTIGLVGNKKELVVAVFKPNPTLYKWQVFRSVKGMTNKDLDPSMILIPVKLDGHITHRNCGNTILRFEVKIFDSLADKYCVVVSLGKKVSFEKDVEVIGHNRNVDAINNLKDSPSRPCKLWRLSEFDRETLMKMRPDFAWMRLEPRKVHYKTIDEFEPNDGAISLPKFFRRLQYLSSGNFLRVAMFCYTGPKCVLGDVLEGQTNDSLDQLKPRIAGVVLSGVMTYVEYDYEKILFEVYCVDTTNYEVRAKLA